MGEANTLKLKTRPFAIDNIQHQETRAISTGNITTTFGVPGKISIPSDGATHNVTVAQMKLNGKMCWVTVPKQEAKAHLIVRGFLTCALESFNVLKS